jgi:hypothetical protein
MKWASEERLRRALPYALYRWNDRGFTVETLFTIKRQPIATRVGGALFMDGYPRPRIRLPPGLRGIPPAGMTPTSYFYGPRSPTGGWPWDAGGAAARRCLWAALEAWGIDVPRWRRAAALEMRWEAKEDEE